MSDASVQSALRSDAGLVVVEAPGGCGKTFQGAAYARDTAASVRPGRLLILTHTHAACSVFHGRTKGLGSHFEIRTIDSLVSEIADAYHQGIGLPPDTASWARRNKDGYDKLAVRAASLIERFPAIAATLAKRYPVIICDEHQDSTCERHAIVMALRQHGSRLRIFADPMQQVFAYSGGQPALDWTSLTEHADAFEELDVPHRWINGCQLLGRWILNAREALKTGGAIELRHGLPPSVLPVRVENSARNFREYRPHQFHRAPIDTFEAGSESLLILSRYTDATRSIRSTFSRRIPLWEGHVRKDLEKFVDALIAGDGNRNAIAAALTDFIQATATGFTAAGYVSTLTQDVSDGCTRKRNGNRAFVQDLARLIVNEPNHIGAAKVLERIAADAAFKSVQLDCRSEFYEASRLGRYASPETGFREITRHRAYTRPHPPAKAISTIHKAKGLECENVIVMPCDKGSFPDSHLSRCLLYVAISRASHRLMLIIPSSNPSPLLRL
jgi:hypothetical protein